jgi:hypothetical protein
MDGADGRGGMHVCVGPMLSSHVGCDGPSSDPLR